MKKGLNKLITCALLLCINWVSPVYAQQPLKWRVDGWCEIDFTGSYGVPLLSQDTLFTSFVNAPYYDPAGNIKFFSNGIVVMDHNMDTLQNSELIYNPNYTLPEIGSTVLNGTLIFPRPETPGQYYIFHSSLTDPVPPDITAYGDLYYSIIDTSLNGGAGAIGPIKNVLLKDSLWIGCINAVKHGNGLDWWLISSKNLSDTIYTWLITKDFINGPFSQAKGWAINTTGLVVSQTAFNETGDRFAIAYAYQPNNIKQLMLFDFNRCTGELTNGQFLVMTGGAVYDSGVTGVAFSKSSRFLYAGTGDRLYQFDLNASNVQASRIRVGTHDYFPSPFQSGFGFLKLGPDNKIYCQTAQGNYAIDVINYPDSLGLACDVQLRQIDYNVSFNSPGANIGVLPHYPNYNLGALTGSACDTLVGVSEQHSNIISPQLNIFYHPSWQTAFINANNLKGTKGTMEIFDMQGKLVYREDMQIANGYYTRDFNMTGLTDGMYFVNINTANDRLTEKLIKY